MFFLFRLFIIFLTSLYDTSLKQNSFGIILFSLILEVLSWFSQKEIISERDFFNCKISVVFIKQALNKFANSSLSVIKSPFCFKAMLLLAKPLSEKKGIIFFSRIFYYHLNPLH